MAGMDRFLFSKEEVKTLIAWFVLSIERVVSRGPYLSVCGLTADIMPKRESPTRFKIMTPHKIVEY